MAQSLNVAYFISPHGFGHGARAAAVMSAIHKQLPQVQFEIYTTLPRWFFDDSIACPFHYHPVRTDIGLVQLSPLAASLADTLDELNRFVPFDGDIVRKLTSDVLENNCHLVISDISALGIAIAKNARLPSVLIENFTWDWIYEAYLDPSSTVWRAKFASLREGWRGKFAKVQIP